MSCTLNFIAVRKDTIWCDIDFSCDNIGTIAKLVKNNLFGEGIEMALTAHDDPEEDYFSDLLFVKASEVKGKLVKNPYRSGLLLYLSPTQKKNIQFFTDFVTNRLRILLFSIGTCDGQIH